MSIVGFVALVVVILIVLNGLFVLYAWPRWRQPARKDDE